MTIWHLDIWKMFIPKTVGHPSNDPLNKKKNNFTLNTGREDPKWFSFFKCYHLCSDESSTSHANPLCYIKHTKALFKRTTLSSWKFSGSAAPAIARHPVSTPDFHWENQWGKARDWRALKVHRSSSGCRCVNLIPQWYIGFKIKENEQAYVTKRSTCAKFSNMQKFPPPVQKSHPKGPFSGSTSPKKNKLTVESDG